MQLPAFPKNCTEIKTEKGELQKGDAKPLSAAVTSHHGMHHNWNAIVITISMASAQGIEMPLPFYTILFLWASAGVGVRLGFVIVFWSVFLAKGITQRLESLPFKITELALNCNIC